MTDNTDNIEFNNDVRELGQKLLECLDGYTHNTIFAALRGTLAYWMSDLPSDEDRKVAGRALKKSLPEMLVKANQAAAMGDGVGHTHH